MPRLGTLEGRSRPSLINRVVGLARDPFSVATGVLYIALLLGVAELPLAVRGRCAL